MNGNTPTTESFLRRHRADIVVFLCAFGVRFAAALVMQIAFGAESFISFSDARDFVLIAQNILEHGIFTQFREPPFIPDAIRLPLHPLFIAAFLLARVPLFVIVAAQNVLAGIAGVLLYRTGIALFRSPAIGMLAAMLYAVEPVAVYWNVLLMSDNLLSFFVIASVYALSRKRYFWAAFLLGLAALTRAIGLYFFPILVLWALFDADEHVRNRVKTAVLMLFIFALTVSPWFLRNKLTFNRWAFSSVGSSIIYTVSMNAFLAERGATIETPNIPPDYTEQSNVTFHKTAFYNERVGQILRAHPVAYPLFHLRAMWRGLGNHDYRYLVDYVLRPKLGALPERFVAFVVAFGRVFWVALYLCMLAAFSNRAYRRPAALLAALILVNKFLLGYSAVMNGGRYNLPVLPAMLLLASCGFFAARERLREFRRSAS